MSLNLVSKNCDLSTPQGKDRLVQTLELMSQRIATLESTGSSSSLSAIPVGMVVWSMLTPAQAPSGWLVCDGSSYQAAEYPLLHTLATAGGVWTVTATTFDTPDLRGRRASGQNDANCPNGVNATWLTRSPAGTGGAETRTLTTTELPSHSHVLNDSGHNHAITDAGHDHVVNFSYSALQFAAGATGSSTSSSNVNSGSNTTGISINNNTTGITMNNTGSGNAFSTEDPILVMTPYVRAR